MRAWYSFPLTELEFWIQLGVSLTVRELRPGTRMILLRPDHPRMRGRFGSIAPAVFDEIVDLPWFKPSSRWVWELEMCARFRRKLREVEFTADSVVTACGMGELVHLVLCRELLRRERLGRPLIVAIEHFADVDTAALAVDVKGTLLRSLYAVPLAGSAVVAYVHRRTRSFMHHRFRPLYDIQLALEHERSTAAVDRLPFPLIGVDTSLMPAGDTGALVHGCVIVFLNDALVRLGVCSDDDAYWNGARALIGHLAQAIGGQRVYVKLHPQSDDRSLARLDGCEFVALSKTESAEELYFRGREQIRAVFSGSSTVLLTATWMGIPAWDCSGMLGYAGDYLRVVAPYFRSAPSIRQLVSAGSVGDALAESGTVAPADREGVLRRWAEAVALVERRLTGLESGASCAVPRADSGEGASA